MTHRNDDSLVVRKNGGLPYGNARDFIDSLADAEIRSKK